MPTLDGTGQPATEASTPDAFESDADAPTDPAGPDVTAPDADAGVDATHLPLDASAIDGSPLPLDASSTLDATTPPLDDSGIVIPDLDGVALPDVACDTGTPVPICVEYFAVLSRCFMRDDLWEACQASLIPDSSASLLDIEQICAINLQRVQPACQ